MSEKRKTVFITYSWDSLEHQQWVLNLAKDLIEKYGIDVILDEFDLKAGSDLPHFMEQAIEKADKVLIILTPKYKVKAEARVNGAGYETTMISQELFESDITNIKFLPIIREGNAKISSPRFLKSKVYRNMVDDKDYYSELIKLAKQIYDHPVTPKPKLGAIPNFDEPSIDPIIDSAKALMNEKNINQELNQLIDSFSGAEILRNEMEAFNKQLNEKVELYKDSTGLNFAYESNDISFAVIRCEKFSVTFEWQVKYSNSAEGAFFEECRISGIISKHNNRFYSTNHQPKLLKRIEYKFDLDYSKKVIWRCDAIKLSSTEIVENAFVFLFGEVSKEIRKDFRR
jgi:hypothetical protein